MGRALKRDVRHSPRADSRRVRPGRVETRLALIERNADSFADIVPWTEGLNDAAALFVVTNPVDVLSYVTWRVSDLPVGRVIGSGTVLDTSRFRHALSRAFEVAPANTPRRRRQRPRPPATRHRRERP